MLRSCVYSGHMDTFILNIKGPLYPALLREIYDPPKRLYCMGNAALLRRPSFGIVGTRRCTSYGRSQTERFSRDLSKKGICIVSGLAFGIDAAAHKAAILEAGSTIAVVAQGLDDIQPRSHAGLVNSILAKNGLVVSENPPGSITYANSYLKRNRIISGLSEGVLIVEARFKSGAVNTAKHALEQNREVFALPGPASSPQSQGTHKLIQNGAQLVTGPEDIWEVLKKKESFEVLYEEDKCGPKQRLFNLSDEGGGGKASAKKHQILFEALKAGPKSLIELSPLFDLNSSDLLLMLSELELRGLLRRHPDGRFALLD